MTIGASKAHITKRYPWRIDDSTVQVLDAESCLWVARVTTTFHTSRNEAEHNFPIIVCEDEVFAELSNDSLRVLGEWCLRQEIEA